MSPRRPPRPSRGQPKHEPERRRNPTLRELLDELVGHVREIARNAKKMSPEQLDYAQQRLEWLADEVWRLATEESVEGEEEE